MMREHGFDVVVEPESFLVTKDSHLEPAEAARAREWGQRLAERVVAGGVSSREA